MAGGTLTPIEAGVVLPTPFCLSTDIAPFHQMLLNNASDFVDGVSKPGKTEIDTFISSITHQIIVRFMLAGYTIPLTKESGAWDTTETEFVKYACIMGVSHMISSPAVSNPGYRGRAKGPFEVEYDEALNLIYDKSTGVAMPFGAAYRSGTPADAANNYGIPLTDYLGNEYAHKTKNLYGKDLADYLVERKAYELSLNTETY